jgi:mitochondrial fission factor
VISGTKSAPREIVLENSILPKSNPGLVRVQTPPRVITLDQHYFPSASDDLNDEENDEEARFYEQRRTLDFSDENKKNNRNKMSHNSHEIVINPR